MQNSSLSVGLEASDFKGIGDLSPLTSPLNIGLPIIAALSFASFIASVSLFAFLCWRLYTWQRRGSQSHNQFVVLIMNLLLADMQQSLGFAFSLNWVANNRISGQSMACSVQAWLIGSGDLASGVWCLFIGLHTASAVIFNMKLKPVPFWSAILLVWAFIYGCNIVQIGLQPEHLYVRAGAWCWVNQHYVNLRLYTHYLWIFVAELGVVGTYAMIFVIILHRIRSGYFKDEEKAGKAKDVAKLMAVYPLVYVICTLPLASARTAAMAGNDVPAVIMVFAGAMITSNGWLDVLLYTLTRRILIFSDHAPAEDYSLDTFSAPWMNDKGSRFGTVTVITAGSDDKKALVEKSSANITPLQKTKPRFGRRNGSDPKDLESGMPDWLENKEGWKTSISCLDGSGKEIYTSGNLGGYSGSTSASKILQPPPTPTKDSKFLGQIRRKSAQVFPPRGSSRRCPKKHKRGVSLDRIRELVHAPQSSMLEGTEASTMSNMSDSPTRNAGRQTAISEHTINIYMAQNTSQNQGIADTRASRPSSRTSLSTFKERPARLTVNTNFSRLDRSPNRRISFVHEPFPLPILPPSESSKNLRRAVLGGRRETTVEIVNEAAKPEDLIEMEELQRRELITPISANTVDEFDKMEFLSTPTGMA